MFAVRGLWGLCPTALLLCCSLAGCGSRETIHPVSGTVRFADGEPLQKGRVVVDSPDRKTSSWGMIMPDGTFVMGTRTSKDGVPAGSYRVFIINAMSDLSPELMVDSVEASRARESFRSKPLIHGRYSNKETSGISFDVPKQLRWDIIVEPPK